MHGWYQWQVCSIDRCSERAVAELDDEMYCSSCWTELMIVLETKRRELNARGRVRTSTGLATLGDFFRRMPPSHEVMCDGKADIGYETGNDSGDESRGG